VKTDREKDETMVGKRKAHNLGWNPKRARGSLVGGLGQAKNCHCRKVERGKIIFGREPKTKGGKKRGKTL